jgi:hypothetical protein
MIPGSGSYARVPTNVGSTVPQYPQRVKDRWESILNGLVLCTALLVIALPIVAIINYPQGVVLEPVLFLEKLYVFVFGCILLAMELPAATIPIVTEFQTMVQRYCKLVTKLMGKAFFMVFIGCNCFNVLNPAVQSTTLQSCIVILGITTAGVGVVNLIFGISKARALNLVRTRMLGHRHKGKPLLPPINVPYSEEGLLEHLKQRETLDAFLQEFSKECPGLLSKQEFIDVCRYVLGRPKFTLTEWDLEMIFDGMASVQKGPTITELSQNLGIPMTQLIEFGDFYEWLRSPLPMII